MQKLAVDVFKTLNSLNPDFWRGSHYAKRENDLFVNKDKNYNAGQKSLRTLGPKIEHSLPEDLKYFQN